MSLGEQLRNAREGKGLSINDIARETFIRAHYLEAIERDDFSPIPPSRLRYFIQDYAKIVDLEAASLLKELPDVPVAPPVAVPAVPSPARSIPPPFVPQAQETVKEKFKKKKEFGEEPEESVAPAASASAEPKSGLRRRRPRYTPLDQGNPALVRGLMTVALLLLIGLGIYFLTGGFDKSGPEETGVAAVEGGDTAAGDDVRILSRSDGTTDSAAAAGEVVAESGDSLVLQGRAIAQVWYSIKMDTRQETGTLDSGQIKVWKAEKEFRVALGNAGGLEFSLNGKPLGVLGPKGKALRPKTIDAQGVKGLSVTPSRPRSSAASRSRTPRRTTEENTSSSRLRRLESTEPRRAVDP